MWERPAIDFDHNASGKKSAVKAVAYDRFGPADVLSIRECPTPSPGKGQVAVSMRATSVNVVDIRARRGELWPLVNKRFPKIPGGDLAGIVSAIGEGVADLKTGDRVFGMLNPFKGGAFADQVLAPAETLARLPDGLDFQDAAALPTAGLAALQAVRDLGRIGPGTSLLLHGGSGGVGLFAIQIAKHLGAHVTAVGGSDGVTAMQEAGADVVIDYRAIPAPRYDRRFDAIINASGRLPYAAARMFLTPTGRLIEPSPTIPLFIGSMAANMLRARKHLMLTTAARRADLEHLARLVLDGALKITIARSFPFAEAKAAFLAQEKGGAVGKIVVTA